jgi:peroxiredoxin
MNKEPHMPAITQGSTAPDFTLQNEQAQTLQLAQFRGKPVLLNFFNSTCPWCQTEMPRLAQIYRRLNDDKEVDVAILGIVVGQDTPHSAAQFAAEKQLDFPIAVDAEGTVRSAYQLERVPTLVLVDGQGIVQRVYEGASEQLAGIVEQTIFAAASGYELPDYNLIGNGCAPD